LIVNGKVVERLFSEQKRYSWKFQTVLDLDESAWIAARTYAEAGTEAHTNPVYVYLDNQLPYKRQSLRQIIVRLESSIETIPNPRIVTRLKDLRMKILKMLEGKNYNLPLPSLP